MSVLSVWRDLSQRLGNSGAVENARLSIQEHDLTVLRVEALVRRLAAASESAAVTDARVPRTAQRRSA